MSVYVRNFSLILNLVLIGSLFFLERGKEKEKEKESLTGEEGPKIDTVVRASGRELNPSPALDPLVEPEDAIFGLLDFAKIQNGEDLLSAALGMSEVGGLEAKNLVEDFFEQIALERSPEEVVRILAEFLRSIQSDAPFAKSLGLNFYAMRAVVESWGVDPGRGNVFRIFSDGFPFPPSGRKDIYAGEIARQLVDFDLRLEADISSAWLNHMVSPEHKSQYRVEVAVSAFRRGLDLGEKKLSNLDEEEVRYVVDELNSIFSNEDNPSALANYLEVLERYGTDGQVREFAVSRYSYQLSRDRSATIAELVALNDPALRDEVLNSAMIQKQYASPDEQEEFLRDIPWSDERAQIEAFFEKNRPVGIGISMLRTNRGIVVRQMLSDSPAARSGELQNGDVIVGIDPGTGYVHDASDMATNDFSRLLKGAEGVPLTLVVESADTPGDTREIVIQRGTFSQ
ncbi:MAG: PDZ domain-containing protein [Verrucomicrobiota bacterium]